MTVMQANGVMVGRMVMDNPWSFLGPLDHYLSLKMPHIFPSSNVCCLTPKQVVHEYLEYVYEEISSFVSFFFRFCCNQTEKKRKKKVIPATQS